MDPRNYEPEPQDSNHNVTDKEKKDDDERFYLKTLGGIAKIVQLCLGIAVIGSTANVGHDAHLFLLILAIFAFIHTVVYLFVFTAKQFCGFKDKWLLADIISGVIVTVLYFLAACVQASNTLGQIPYILAAVFAFVNAIAYGFGVVMAASKTNQFEKMIMKKNVRTTSLRERHIHQADVDGDYI